MITSLIILALIIFIYFIITSVIYIYWSRKFTNEIYKLEIIAHLWPVAIPAYLIGKLHKKFRNFLYITRDKVERKKNNKRVLAYQKEAMAIESIIKNLGNPNQDPLELKNALSKAQCFKHYEKTNDPRDLEICIDYYNSQFEDSLSFDETKQLAIDLHKLFDAE